jgi:DNA repair photolyase
MTDDGTLPLFPSDEPEHRNEPENRAEPERRIEAGSLSPGPLRLPYRGHASVSGTVSGAVTVRETTAKTVLRRLKGIDPWFLASGSMNLYRGCTHDCAYCDGRTEHYRVAGEFGREVEVKVNAPEVLARELDRSRKRSPVPGGYLIVGGGVGDSFQPLEIRYGLTERTLEVLERSGRPVHLLTKSSLVAEYLPLLLRLHGTRSVLVSFSLSTADDGLAAVFEPGASPPSERLEALARLRKAGIHGGVYLTPLVPLLTDTPARIRETIVKSLDAGAEYAVWGCMTLKEGRQREHFYSVLGSRFPELEFSYDTIYPGDRWGNPTEEYRRYAAEAFAEASKPFRFPKRIPPRLFPSNMTENERIAVMLEHLDAISRERGYDSTYGWAARSVRAAAEPLSAVRTKLRGLSGVGPSTERLIREILDTGTSRLYERLLVE